MDYKKELKELQGSIIKDFTKITKVLDIHLAQIPENKLVDIAPIRSDIQRIMNNVKAGDVDAINEITKKYANNH